MWEPKVKTICRKSAQLAAQETPFADDVSFHRFKAQN